MADQASEVSEKLSRQTDGLAGRVGDLLTVAEEQKNLAATLESQTNKLIGLTWALLAISVALLVAPFIQAYVTVNKDSRARMEQVETGQSNQPPTNWSGGRM